MPKLTDLSLRSLPVPTVGQVTYDDEGSPLKVRVSQGGTKTFIVILGSGRRHTIGRYPTVSLSQARSAAVTLKAEKALGRVIPQAVSLADARQEYLEQLEVRPKTRDYYVRHLKKLKGPRLTDVTPREITRILGRLPGPSRTQALASFRPFFKWCIDRNYLDRSPCERLKGTKAGSRARVLTDDELKAIWQACEVAVETEVFSPTFARIVQLLILTGQRRTETASLQTAWVTTLVGDLWEHKTITFPAEVTKNAHEHVLPIGKTAAAMIEQRTRATNAVYLFPARGRDDRAFTGWSKSKKALDKLSGVTGWRLHDLRRTVATRLAELGVEPHIIERILNHVSGSLSPIALVYNRARYMQAMRDAIDLWEAYVLRCVKPCAVAA